MPTFILAGYPRSLVNEVKNAVAKCAELFSHWKYLLEPGDKKTEAFISKKHAERLLTLANDHDGAHIFAVTGRGDEHWENVIKPYFRLRQVATSAVGQTGNGNFDPLSKELEAATIEEDYWINTIKPTNTGDPLILPQNFATNRALRQMWHLAESFNNRRNLEAAAALIDKFRKEHRQSVGSGKTPWIDADSWVWKDSGARHGNPEFPEDWKYSYRLPDGFHYDVSSKKGTKTHFRDVDGVDHVLKDYVNVTSHGTVRGK